MLLTGHKSRAFSDRYNIIREQELLDAGDQLVAHLAQQAQGAPARRAGATITAPSASPPPSNASAGVSAPCSPSAALSPPPASMPISATNRVLTTTFAPGRSLPSVLLSFEVLTYSALAKPTV